MTRSDMAIHPGTGTQTWDVSLVILFLMLMTIRVTAGHKNSILDHGRDTVGIS